jgi:hypothetical protein
MREFPGRPFNKVLPWATCCVVLAACTSPRDARWHHHSDSRRWQDGIAQHVTDPHQYGPELMLAASLPFLIGNDSKLSRDLVKDPVFTNGDPDQGDTVVFALGGAAAGSAALDYILGDEGKSVEVLLESVVLTESIVAILKDSVRRHRPGSNSNKTSSFPSSHASVAFTMATFLNRRLAEELDGNARYLGWLLYVPATFVAISRVESEKHFPTDVVAGAFLGTVITNWIYNTHYGSPDHDGIFGDPRVHVFPQFGEDWAGLTLGFSF